MYKCFLRKLLYIRNNNDELNILFREKSTEILGVDKKIINIDKAIVIIHLTKHIKSKKCEEIAKKRRRCKYKEMLD